MIPDDRNELHILAGEYVLGVLEPDTAREVEEALASHDALRRAVTFWEERLHPLAALAPPAEPPEELWRRIEKSIAALGRARTPLLRSLAFWRGATGLATAIAAGLALYIVLAPPLEPRYVAVLHAPQGIEPAFVATSGEKGLFVRAVATAAAPEDRSFELWAIPKGEKPRSLGLIPADGRLELGALPAPLGDGVTLAITIEPKSGAPHASPSSAPVFLGTVVAAR
jgi:anti-sigma-K factor RskA